MKSKITLVLVLFSCKNFAQQILTTPEQIFSKASNYLLNGEYTLAQDHFKQAIREFEKLNDLKGKNDSKVGLATVLFIKGEYDDSLKLFNSVKADITNRLFESQGDLSSIDFAIQQCQLQILAKEKQNK